MRKILMAFILLFSFAKNYAQADTIIYYQNQLRNATADSAKIEILTELGWKYLFIKVDSSVYYAQQALKLSQKTGFVRGEINAYQIMARAMRGYDNYSEELRLALLYLKKSEELKDTVTMFFAKREIMWCYGDIGDYNKSLEYALSLLQLINTKALKGEQNDDKFGEMAYRFLGNAFQRLNKSDSAIKYLMISHSIALKMADPEMLALNTGTLARYYLNHNKIDSAFFYYRKSLPNAQAVFRYDIVNQNYIGLSSAFLKSGNADSALRYARQALENLRKVPDSSNMKIAARLISDIYKFQNKTDSAYAYLSYADSLNELLAEQEKIKQAKDMFFNKSLQEQQIQNAREQAEVKYENNKKIFLLISILAIVLVAAYMFYRSSKQRQKDAIKIQQAYDQLKSTQSQLIQSEKMASLGELTAGIAHEIQNPLNFVNNFSEINTELIDEVGQELEKGNLSEAKKILNDIKDNEQKISHHGKRADGIVKGMLQHSRSSSGTKESTDINALCDEYLRLAYHGLRAKDKSFNATMKTDFDNSIGNINIIPQDIGRVILNLINNAFYAVDEKKKQDIAEYEPTVMVGTKKNNGKVEIKVADNGGGIPQKVLEKIFQPFFTTKPTGQGTGLGLSLSYDIIKAHGGEIKVETKEGEGSEFIIQLPVN